MLLVGEVSIKAGGVEDVIQSHEVHASETLSNFCVRRLQIVRTSKGIE
jgi:urease accessory protein UreF